jgi:hypothetical protein
MTLPLDIFGDDAFNRAAFDELTGIAGRNRGQNFRNFIDTQFDDFLSQFQNDLRNRVAQGQSTEGRTFRNFLGGLLFGEGRFNRPGGLGDVFSNLTPGALSNPRRLDAVLEQLPEGVDVRTFLNETAAQAGAQDVNLGRSLFNSDFLDNLFAAQAPGSVGRSTRRFAPLSTFVTR